MIDIAILDDEVIFTKFLHDHILKILFESKYEFRITTYTNYKNFINDLEENKIFHLLCLDIEMPEIDGIEFAKSLYSFYPDLIIIFITSKDNLVFNAFGLNIFDFISKRNIIPQLESSIYKLLEHLEVHKTIVLNTSIGVLTLRKDDIYYVETIGRKVYLHTLQDKYQIYGKNLSEIIRLLNDKFIYINRSCLINMGHILRYSKNQIELLDTENTRLEISFNRYNDVHKKIMSYHLLNK